MKKILAIFLVVLMVISFSSCNKGSNDSQQDNQNSKKDTSLDNSGKEDSEENDGNSGKEKEVVVLPFLFTNAGNDSQYELNNFFFDQFNSKFEGEYRIEVEWLPGMAEDIRAKLKVLNASSDLPALVTNLNAEPAFAELLIENNRLMDLTPYFNESKNWKANSIKESVNFNIRDNGKMYTSPAITASYIGIFYNKEHLKEVGYETIPDNWEDFWSLCDALKEKDHIPVSLHTTETGWCSMLFATAFMAKSEEGKQFLTQKYPNEFSVPVFKEAMKMLNRLFAYTSSDAIGGKYALAANNFTAENTSMIANGPWMIASLSDLEYSPEGFEENVGYATFPGQLMISDQGANFGDGVSMDHPIEVREGVVKWLKMLAEPENIRKVGVVKGDFSAIIPLNEDDLANLSPTMQEYSKAISRTTQTIKIYQGLWDPITQNEVIPTELPSMVTGQITVDEFCKKMNEGAAKYLIDTSEN